MAPNASSSEPYVVINLSVSYPPSNLEYAERRVRLDAQQDTLHIGRHSKSRIQRAAAKDNGLFDSAVMSRDHAIIQAEFETQTVHLMDVGSLHGTFVNGKKLVVNQKHKLRNDDLVRFGIDIMSADTNHPPLAIEVTYHFENTTDAVNGARLTVYQVPDDSDDGNSTDQSDSDSVVEYQPPAPIMASTQIDLTGGGDTDLGHDYRYPNFKESPQNRIDLTEAPSPRVTPQEQAPVGHELVESPVARTPVAAPMSATMAATHMLFSAIGPAPVASSSPIAAQDQSHFWPGMDGSESDDDSIDENMPELEDISDSDNESVSLSPSEAYDPDEMLDNMYDESNSSDIYGDSLEDSDIELELGAMDDPFSDSSSERSEASGTDAKAEPVTQAPPPTPKISIQSMLSSASPTTAGHQALASTNGSASGSQSLPPITRIAFPRLPTVPISTAERNGTLRSEALPRPNAVTAPLSAPQRVASLPFLRPDSKAEQPLPDRVPARKPVPVPATNVDTAGVVETVLTVSGDKFLSTPLPEPRVNAANLDDDGHDVASAYEFEVLKRSRLANAQSAYELQVAQLPKPEMSKKAASSYLEDRVMEKVAKSLKRKAGGISRLTPEEESHSAAETPSPMSDAALEPKTPESKALGPDDVAILGDQPVSPSLTEASPDAVGRPSKMRKVAEAAAYVAIGGAATGVALLSALIATAPSFS